MSSGFPGGVPDFFSGSRRSTTMPNNTNLNTQHQFPLRSPIDGIPLPNPSAQIRRPELIGKRSLAEFQQQNFYLRNVKPRNISTPIYGLPIVHNQLHINHNNTLPNSGLNYSGPDQGPEFSAREQSMLMSHKLQELEKKLLADEEDDGEPVSAITESEWSDTIQDLISPARKPVSTSPTSSSSSCSSTSASPPPLPSLKQALIDAADAISDGKPEAAAELLTRLHQQAANARGTPEQRLAANMVAALRPRVGHAHPSSREEEHAASTQMLYDVSPCFKLGFMAANLSILEAAAEGGFQRIHVVDFDIGRGGQYVHLLHAIAARAKKQDDVVSWLTITAVVDALGGDAGEKLLKMVGEGLEALANRIGVALTFNVRNMKLAELSRENLRVHPGEALAVNFAFNLYKLPDESVTTENLRDETLRRVKGMSPEVMTVVEQELNTNTALLAARVRDAWEYYGLLFDSLDSTMSRDSPERVRIEEGLGRKMGNAIGCEGMDRVERCEVFGKWRARMSMAGFQLRPMSGLVVDSLRVKVNSGTRGNPGFSVNEESGGIGFGWMGRNLTVASAWR